MAGENTLNFHEQGGERWVVGGELNIPAGGKITPDGGTQPTIAALTDSTGGTANDTLAAVGATDTTNQAAAINNNFADVGAKINAILTALQGAGILG